MRSTSIYQARSSSVIAILMLALVAAGTSCRERTIQLDPNKIISDQAKEGKAMQEKFRVEAACGQCQFGLPGEGCDLAIRLDGKAYYVDGTNIDDHGDAHAHDGFCNAIRQAEVRGRIEGERFLVESFHLLPEDQD